MNPSTPPAPAGQNPWPIAIVCYFIIFIAFIAWFITFAMRQKMDLVRDDYYDQEIRFQQQIDRAQRTQSVSTQVTIAGDAANHFISIGLPREQAAQSPAGTILLYRPSDASLDQQFALKLDADGVQRLDVHALLPGLWKVRVQWTIGGQDYSFDKNIVLKRPAGST
ncbi:MAG: FixH family protein [Limisphaerales bacterium]